VTVGTYASHTICGIPCTLRIDGYENVPGRDTWDSADDFHGWEEVEFTVCDQRGRPAPWLERKMSEADWRDAEEAAMRHCREAAAEDHY
jgi:hypothetical protein